MSTINIGGTPSYTIPLDSLDLAYLSKYVQTPRAEKTPLWTKKRLDGESEYCQVQIVTQDNNNEDCYCEASDTYQCHYCNINVPKACYQKHNESEQYETIKKIYQKVFERVSKQMNANSMNTDEDIGNDLYYCEPCSKIIKIENKNKHEATEYHAKSVKSLIVINEFYKILNENNSFDENEELLGEESYSFNPNNNDDRYDEDMEASSSVDSDSDLRDTDSSPLPVRALSIIEIKNQIRKHEMKKQNFGNYLKNVIKKYNLKVALPVVEGEFITIVAPNGDKVKVSREHFQGYKEINNSMFCQLCDMWILRNTKAHDVSKKHVRRIFRPINDKFARWVDKDWSHCVPCNELVQRHSDLHNLNDVHNNMIKETLTTKNDKTLCEDCNLYIETHNFSFHLNSEEHLNVLMKQNSIQDIGNKETFCKICNLTLPKYALKFHIGTKKHLAGKANYPTVLSSKNNDCTEIKDEDNEDNADTDINNKNNESLPTGVNVLDAGVSMLCKVRVLGDMKIFVDGKPHQETVAQLTSIKNDVKPNEHKEEIGAKSGIVADTDSSASTNSV